MREEQAGLPAYGGNRRVAGLRREEVALLAGVSVGYYTRLERGNAHGVSESVLEALARALHLDEAERAHLFDLARAASTSTTARTSRHPARQQVRPSVQRILDSMTTTPAYVRNGHLDILAANRLGKALFSPAFDSPAGPRSETFRISAYTAEPGTPSRDALNLLASWAATLEQDEAAHATDRT